MSELDFLKHNSDVEPPEAKVTPPPVEPTPTPPPQVSPAAVAPPTITPEDTPPADPDARVDWRVAKALDERTKRQELERKYQELEAKYADATKVAPVPIDPIADPEGFERAIQQRQQESEWKLITKVSHQFAVKAHGAEKVKAAEEWLDKELKANPAMFQAIQRQDDPYDFVVRQHLRALRMDRLGDDEPETFAEKWARENGYVKAGELQQGGPVEGALSPQSPVKPPLPRPSIAGAPAAAPRPKSDVMQSEDEAFSEVFSRKR